MWKRECSLIFHFSVTCEFGIFERNSLYILRFSDFWAYFGILLVIFSMASRWPWLDINSSYPNVLVTNMTDRNHIFGSNYYFSNLHHFLTRIFEEFNDTNLFTIGLTNSLKLTNNFSDPLKLFESTIFQFIGKFTVVNFPSEFLLV